MIWIFFNLPALLFGDLKEAIVKEEFVGNTKYFILCFGGVFICRPQPRFSRGSPLGASWEAERKLHPT